MPRIGLGIQQACEGLIWAHLSVSTPKNVLSWTTTLSLLRFTAARDCWDQGLFGVSDVQVGTELTTRTVIAGLNWIKGLIPEGRKKATNQKGLGSRTFS